MDDEGRSGLILDTDLPLASLARTLKLAEAEVYRRMLELVEAVRPEMTHSSPTRT
jgi:hypothetical protein